MALNCDTACIELFDKLLATACRLHSLDETVVGDSRFLFSSCNVRKHVNEEAFQTARTGENIEALEMPPFDSALQMLLKGA
ncbi:hypothetical protein Tcan_03396 [Toxocara canis]|uniref:Uncharacterized protein n=1 Tax=Toxocara canis TaxID=6265 RepID=A0A0B2V0P8_TOXCA|nr:hypothetical protein Tcan_03396 [Toxocara canis]